MKRLYKKTFIWLIKKELTLCEVLNKLGYISDLELYIEGIYNKKTVKPHYCFMYRLGIAPIAWLLMKYPRLFGKFANWGVRYFWLDKALKDMINNNVRLKK